MSTTPQGYKRVTDSTVLTDGANYAVVASYKDGDGEPFVKHTGTYDECADYAERNDSPDNAERYYVAVSA